jgi:hypothetical protein
MAWKGKTEFAYAMHIPNGHEIAFPICPGWHAQSTVQAYQGAAGGVAWCNETHEMKMVAFSPMFDLPSQRGIDGSARQVRRVAAALPGTSVSTAAPAIPGGFAKPSAFTKGLPPSPRTTDGIISPQRARTPTRSGTHGAAARRRVRKPLSSGLVPHPGPRKCRRHFFPQRLGTDYLAAGAVLGFDNYAIFMVI